MDKTDLRLTVILIVIAAASLAVETATYIGEHPISIPLPQSNASNSSYMTLTIVRPSFIPVIPAFARPYVAVIFVASLVTGIAFATYRHFQPIKVPSPPQWDRNQYKDRVHRDVLQIEESAKKADKTIDIQFSSWNRNIDHSKKPLLIDDTKLYDALQNLSDAVNDRNFYRYSPKFKTCNELVLTRCEELRKLHFID